MTRPDAADSTNEEAVEENAGRIAIFYSDREEKVGHKFATADSRAGSAADINLPKLEIGCAKFSTINIASNDWVLSPENSGLVNGLLNVPGWVNSPENSGLANMLRRKL